MVTLPWLTALICAHVAGARFQLIIGKDVFTVFTLWPHWHLVLSAVAD
jgi:hypothetical protein